MKKYELILIRIFDILFSFCGLLVCLPIILVVLVLVKITSKGPAFFIQQRRGYLKKRIKIIKFRTMKHGSERFEHLIIKHQKKPNIQIKNDKRITKLGRILRRTSIDELPQLAVILLGKMSFVGPRPIIEEEYKMLTAYQLQRFSVKPGLTGLAQINGRSQLNIYEAFKKDIQWTKHASLKNYFIILLKTAITIFKKQAY